MAQLDPPVPILAQWFGFPANHVIVTFNHQLAPGVLDHTNWTAIFGLQAYAGSAAVAAGNTVNVTMVNAGIGAPVNSVTYTPPPFDVRTPHGTPAAGFAAFPIT